MGSFLFLFSGIGNAQSIKNQEKVSNVKAGCGVSFSFFSFNNSSITFQITSKPSDKELFFGNGNSIFLSHTFGKREQMLIYERGFGRHQLKGNFNEKLKISYSKIDYIFYFSKVGASVNKFDMSFGLVASFISSNIRREWTNTVRIYQGIESDFKDFGFGFNLFSSYGFRKFSLFLSTNTILYIDNVIPSYSLTFGVVGVLY